MDSIMSGRTALIAGATGLVGGNLLHLLLDAKEYERVIALVRRPLSVEHPKLTTVTVDFDKLENESIARVDDAFCCLGTTIKKTKTREAFRVVDFEYPVKLAEVALRTGAQRFLVVSSMGANPGSMFFYNRVKGELEARLKEMHIPQLHIFRPSLLLGKRNEVRPGERIGEAVLRRIHPLMLGPLLKYRAIEASQVAYAMYRTAVAGTEQRIGIYESDKIAGMK